MDTEAHFPLNAFLVRAKRATYAASENAAALAAAQRPASRPASHDLAYEEGSFRYLDSYLGGERFAGEEAVWRADVPVWSMNYYGVMLCAGIPDGFSTFLKAALSRIPVDAPFRGPSAFAQDEYSYACEWQGDMQHFRGSEWIYRNGTPIYTLDFHGGSIQ